MCRGSGVGSWADGFDRGLDEPPTFECIYCSYLSASGRTPLEKNRLDLLAFRSATKKKKLESKGTLRKNKPIPSIVFALHISSSYLASHPVVSHTRRVTKRPPSPPPSKHYDALRAFVFIAGWAQHSFSPVNSSRTRRIYRTNYRYDPNQTQSVNHCSPL